MNSVYFARFGDYVKIGFSSNPAHRLKAMTTGVILPDDLDPATPGELVMVIPFCRVRDERNLHQLFMRHRAAGEWFHWTPEFEHQMRTMQFVTHATRQKWLRKVRADLGLTGKPPVKEYRAWYVADGGAA